MGKSQFQSLLVTMVEKNVTNDFIKEVHRSEYYCLFLSSKEMPIARNVTKERILSKTIFVLLHL